MSDEAATTVDEPATATELSPVEIPWHEPYEHGGIHRAFAAAQGAFPPIVKNKTAKIKYKDSDQTYEYQYSDLAAIFDAVRKPLSIHGISVRHEISKGDAELWIEAIVTHESGQELRSGKLPLPPSNGNMQVMGSALTYARRYTANVVLGLCPEDDDDAALSVAHVASHPESAPQQRTQGQQSQRSQPAKSGDSKKPGREVIIGAIGKIGTAAGLAKYLLDRMGETPVAKAPNGWSQILTAAVTKLNAMQWTPEQKASVEAVLTTIRAALPAKVETPVAAPAAEPVVDETPAPVEIPSLVGLQQMAESQLTPGDLLALVQYFAGDEEIPVAVRANSSLWAELLTYLDNMIHERCEKGMWAVQAAEPVGSLVITLREATAPAKEASSGN